MGLLLQGSHISMQIGVQDAAIPKKKSHYKCSEKIGQKMLLLGNWLLPENWLLSKKDPSC